MLNVWWVLSRRHREGPFWGFRVLERVSLSALGLCLPVGSGVFAGTVLFQCFLLESLILAQDERWRRA